MLDYTQALQGGILIGVACWMLLAGIGRIAGVSGITAGVLTTRRQSSAWRWFFLGGLVLGGLLFDWLLNAPEIPRRSMLLLVPAGFLVGFGTVLGSGCTSGHGVCGLGRRSPRSLVAVAVFTVTAVLVVTLTTLMPPVEWWIAVLEEGFAHLIGR